MTDKRIIECYLIRDNQYLVVDGDDVVLCLHNNIVLPKSAVDIEKLLNNQED